MEEDRLGGLISHPGALIILHLEDIIIPHLEDLITHRLEGHTLAWVDLQEVVLEVSTNDGGVSSLGDFVFAHRIRVQA